MILYTPLSWEDIFPAEPVPAPLAGYVNGRLCLVRVGPDGTPRIERLLSTDPQDYLDPALQPATPVSWSSAHQA
jgi:hypothetical protein